MSLTSHGNELLEGARKTLNSFDMLLTQAKKLKGNIAGQVKLGINMQSESLRITRREAEIAERNGQLAVWQGSPIKIDLLFAFPKSKYDDPVISAMIKLHQNIWKGEI